MGVGLCAALCAGLACASAPRPAPAPSATLAAAPVRPEPAAASEGAGLTFAVEPADAEVLVDARSLGKVADLPRGGAVPLQPGLYQVSLRRPGYATWRAEVAVRAGFEPIRVTLTRRQP
jgi:hypothetical protein